MDLWDIKHNALLLLIALFAAGAQAETTSQLTNIKRTDNSEIQFITQRDLVKSTKIPVVLFIDGSGCYSARWEKVFSYWALPTFLHGSAASIVVEKPGMKPEMAVPKKCPDEFLQYYSIDQRVLDHLRVIQHLRKHASWWNGEIYLLGWSDGAAIGARVAAYTPEVKRAVLGGMGGAIPMKQHFKDVFACAPERFENKQARDACIEGLNEQFEKIRTNPTWKSTWGGADNSYKVWATRLDQIEYHLLKDFSIPFLVVHGGKDRNSVPVENARTLMKWLKRDGVKNVEYWEIAEMKHATRSLGKSRSELVRVAMIKWLFSQDPGIGGPPNFGKPVN